MVKEYRLKGLSSLSLGPGAKQEVEVEGIEGGKVLLVHAAGRIQAIGAKCTHYGAPLARGVLTKSGRLTCPWHGACFNAGTGDVEDAPAMDALPVFPVTERDGAFYILADDSAVRSSRRRPDFAHEIRASDTKREKVVVVGGGSGALGVVEGLREKGYRGAVTVVSNEGCLPIDRTKLSKTLLTDPDKLAWRDNSWLTSASIDWIDGEVTGVDFSQRSITTKTGSKIEYGTLILATGGTARKLPMKGFKDLGNIFTLRNAWDAQAIVEAIGSKGKRIVVVGASFIGMEVAKATCKDNHVTVVDMSKTPLAHVLGQDVGTGLQKFVEAQGVKFHMSASIDRAEPSSMHPSKVGAVCLKDGTRLEADLVITGVGVSPATEFLKNNAALPLEPDGSLRVDHHFRIVGLQDVYAVGDIAKYPYGGPGGGGALVRIEHWNVAQNAGRTAAAHIVSKSAPGADFIPVFWSALGAQLRYCGNAANGWDDVVIRGNPIEATFAAYYTKGDEVVAMASMNMDPAMAQSAELMRLGAMPGKSQLQQGLDVTNLAIPQ